MWILNYWPILRHHDSLADKWDKLDTDEQFANWHKEYGFKIAQRISNSSQNQPFFSCWIKGPNFLFSDLQLETRILGCLNTGRMKNLRSQPNHISVLKYIYYFPALERHLFYTCHGDENALYIHLNYLYFIHHLTKFWGAHCTCLAGFTNSIYYCKGYHI